ncbi:MAG: HDOD domain-containing protein [Methylophilaceae bacterium]
MSDLLDFAELKASGVLPSPKGVALTVMQLCQKEEISLVEVAQIIRGDPVLAGRIIKIANAINPNKRRPIASVSPETLIIIGTNTVQQIVLGFSLVNAKQEHACDAFDYETFWSRSIATASAAQAMGETTHIAPPAEMFTCGLLANVGSICLATARPNAYCEVLHEMAGKSSSVLAGAETTRFGLNHRDLTLRMMEDWGIPKLYAEAVFFHENPESSWFNAGSRPQKLTLELHIAGLLAEACLTKDANTRDTMMSHICQLGEAQGIEIVQMISIADQTAREWHDWGKLLGIDTPMLPPFLPPSNLTPVKNGNTSTNPLRILVVDDEMIAFIFSKMLGNAGHTVFTTTDAHEALEIAKREKPQVIISDWLTPEMDGAALCRALREHAETRSTHFIMLTSKKDEQKRNEALRAGVNAYLSKPFDVKEINAELLKVAKS